MWEGGIETKQVSLVLDASEQARFAMPMASDQVLLVTRAGTVIVTTPASASSMTVGQLHGEVRHAVSTGEGAGVVLRTADDGAYRITVDDENRIRVRRYVLQSPVAVQEELDKAGLVSVARMCPIHVGREFPVLVTWTPMAIAIKPEVVGVCAWTRSNGRLASLFERSEEFSAQPVLGTGYSFLQMRGDPVLE